MRPIVNYLEMTLDLTCKGEAEVFMSAYVDDVLNGSRIPGLAKSMATEELFEVKKKLGASEDERSNFHSLVATLLYLTERTKLECLTAVSFLATRVTKCTEDEIEKLERLVRYIRYTSSVETRSTAYQGENLHRRGIRIAAMAIVHSGLPGTKIANKKKGTKKCVSSQIEQCSVLPVHHISPHTFVAMAMVHRMGTIGVYVDSTSHTGNCVVIGDVGLVHCKSSKQSATTKSSTEAELMAASDSMNQALYLRWFSIDQGYPMDPVTVYQDNTSTMTLLRERKPGAERTRYVDKRHFLDRVKAKEAVIVHPGTKRIYANILTKPLQGAHFMYERICPTGWSEETKVEK